MCIERLCGGSPPELGDTFLAPSVTLTTTHYIKTTGFAGILLKNPGEMLEPTWAISILDFPAFPMAGS